MTTANATTDINGLQVTSEIFYSLKTDGLVGKAKKSIWATEIPEMEQGCIGDILGESAGGKYSVLASHIIALGYLASEPIAYGRKHNVRSVRILGSGAEYRSDAYSIYAKRERPEG